MTRKSGSIIRLEINQKHILKELNKFERNFERIDIKIDEKIKTLHDEIRNDYQQREKNFRWAIGLLIVTFLTIIATLLGYIFTVLN